MTYISNFEHGTRGIQAIHLLNEYKNFLKGRKDVIEDEKLDTLRRSLSAAHGDASSSDLASYYFKDSNAISSSVSIEIGKIMREILSEDEVGRLVKLSSSFLEKDDMSDEDKAFISSILERVIENVDSMTRQKMGAHTSFENFGF